jgi:hypothetical protein
VAYSNNTVNLLINPVRLARKDLLLDPGVGKDVGKQGILILQSFDAFFPGFIIYASQLNGEPKFRSWRPPWLRETRQQQHLTSREKICLSIESSVEDTRHPSLHFKG